MRPSIRIMGSLWVMMGGYISWQACYADGPVAAPESDSPLMRAVAEQQASVNAARVSVNPDKEWLAAVETCISQSGGVFSSTCAALNAECSKLKATVGAARTKYETEVQTTLAAATKAAQAPEGKQAPEGRSETVGMSQIQGNAKIEAAWQEYTTTRDEATQSLQASCQRLCTEAPQVCTSIQSAIAKATQADVAEKQATSGWLMKTVSGLTGMVAPMLLQEWLKCHEFDGSRKEIPECQPKAEEAKTRDFWCYDAAAGKWKQLNMLVSEAQSKGCQLDKPEGEKEKQKAQGPQVAGLKGDGGSPLEAKQAGEQAGATGEKEDKFSDTDLEQDPKKAGQKGAGSVGRGSGWDGGFGGRSGFAPSGVISESGRKDYKGGGRSGYSGADVGYGSGGGGRGGYDGRSPMDTLAVDTGRLGKHQATSYQKTETTKTEELVQPEPEKSIFERVEDKYKAYAVQFSN